MCAGVLLRTQTCGVPGQSNYVFELTVLLIARAKCLLERMGETAVNGSSSTLSIRCLDSHFESPGTVT